MQNTRITESSALNVYLYVPVFNRFTYLCSGRFRHI